MRRFLPFSSSTEDPHNSRKFTRRHFLAGAMAATAGIALYGDEVSRHELDTAEKTFHLRRLPAEFHGYRIAQFSDIHLEEFTEEWFLEKVIRKVNDLQPDLVLVTGDFISRGPGTVQVSINAAASCGRLLKELHCPLRYGILGNHDFVLGRTVLRQMLADAGFPLLVNEFIPLRRGTAQLILSGLDNWTFGKPNLELSIPPAAGVPVIAMVHEPDFINIMAKSPLRSQIDLVLSGHTHGGQVRLPGLPAFSLPPLGQLYPEGHYQVGDMQLYVNRGLGTVGIPMRLNCPPELTLITLQLA